MLLITGGAGFIGSSQARHFVKKGEDVRILDNFSTGILKNIDDIKNDVEILRGSIGNKRLVRKALKDVDLILHNAAFVGVQSTIDDPWKVFVENNLNSHKFFDEVVKSGIRKIIFASSSEVYGNYSGVLKEDGPVSPETPYGTAKLLTESYCRILYEQYGIDSCSLRYFNVYGPRQNSSPYGFVVSIFLSRALANRPLRVFGDGKQTRDFTYIDDAIEAVEQTIKKKTRGEAINIGTGSEIAIGTLARKILKATKRKVSIVYTRTRRDEVRRRCADNLKAKKILKWNPQTSLEDGLKSSWEWMKNEHI